MGESIKAVLSLFVIIGVFGSWFAWAGDMRQFGEHVPMIRFGLGAGGALSLGILLWACFRRDKLPDFLRRVSRDHLECDGLSFIVVPMSKDGICILRIFFQNRYARDCQTRLLLRPSIPTLGIRRPKDLAAIQLTIDCPGGAFGMLDVPYPVPADRQGAKVSFDVGGSTKYPGGCGKAMRFREGARVGPATDGRIPRWRW